MSYELSFEQDFFVGPDDEPEISDHPTSVAQALRSKPPAWWDELEFELAVPSGMLTVDDVLVKVQETNTCSNLDSPVTVWIDEEGYFTVDVYDKETQ